MNYFSHYYILPDQNNAYFTLGSILPDMLRNAKSEFSNLDETENFFDSDYLIRGIKTHIEVDKVFHNSNFFKENTKLFAMHLRASDDITMKKYTQFYAHIIIELLLDYDLIKNNKILLSKFYSLLDLIDYNVVETFFIDKFPSQDVEMFWEKFDRFRKRKFLNQYVDIDKVIEFSFYVYEKATKKKIDRSEFDNYKSLISERLLPIIQENNRNLFDCLRQAI